MARRFPWRSALAIALTLGVLGGCGLPAAIPVGGGLDQALEATQTGRAPVVAIRYRNANTLTALVDAGLDLWGVDATTMTAYGTPTERTLAVAKRAGLSVTVTGRLKALNSFDSQYHTYDEMLDELQALAQKHPELCRLEDIGDGWEKTQGQANRDIWSLRIGKGDVSSKPAVVFLGEHHARELVTPEIVLNIAKLLLEGYGKDAEITYLVENRDIRLVPMVNPDGHDLAAKGKDWRKNKDTSYGLTSFPNGPNGPGVDLNRNYGFKWGGPGASAEPSSATFRGGGPFSEPETQAVRDMVKSRKFTFLMTYHSFSNLILWPWGYTDQAPPDNRLPAIGKKLASFNGYKPQQSKDLYKTSGDTCDWAFGELGTLAYTTEIGTWGDGFDPPFSKVAKFWDENRPGALYLLKLAENPNAVFGPEVQAVSRNGRIEAASNKRIVRAEAFVGRAGAPGTGMPLSVTAGKAVGTLHVESRVPVAVRAQDASGAWGPLTVVWGR